MIQDNIVFDERRDLSPVDQFGFIDLKSSLAESVVPSQMPESETDYNGIDEPDKVLGKPRDVFEAIDAQKAAEFIAASERSEEKTE